MNGACQRLLTDKPDNGTLKLLQAFSVFILEVDNPLSTSLIDRALKTFVEGFSRFASLKEDEWKIQIEKFRNYLLASSANQKLYNLIDLAIEQLGIAGLTNSFSELKTLVEQLKQQYSN